MIHTARRAPSTLAGALALLALLPGSQAAPAPLYTAQPILSGGLAEHVNAISLNDLGQVVGTYSRIENGAPSAFVWEPSKGFSQLLRPDGRWLSHGVGINNSGQITGAFTIGRNQEAFLYHNGTTTDLGTLGGPNSSGASINSSGHVTGAAQDASGRERAFVYDGSTMRSLGTLPGYDHSRGSVINDNGQVAGILQQETGEVYPMFYSDGRMQTLQGPSGETRGSVSDMNNAGQLALNFRNDMGENWAVVWSAENGASYVPMPDAYPWSWTTGINDAGDAVGYGLNHTGRFLYLHSEGETFDLLARVAPHVLDTWDISSVTDINNQGQMLVSGRLIGTDIYSPLLLTPVPEPATTVLAAVGLAMLYWRMRRRPRSASSRNRYNACSEAFA